MNDPLIAMLGDLIAHHPGDINPVAQELIETARLAQACAIAKVPLCLCVGEHKIGPSKARLEGLELANGNRVDVDIYLCLECNRVHLFPRYNALTALDIGTPETIQRIKNAVEERSEEV